MLPGIERYEEMGGSGSGRQRPGFRPSVRGVRSFAQALLPLFGVERHVHVVCDDVSRDGSSMPTDVLYISTHCVTEHVNQGLIWS